MNNCNICNSSEEVELVGEEYRCSECNEHISEVLSDFDIEDEPNVDDEFWANVLADELEGWTP